MSIRVLFVDDDALVTRTAARALRSHDIALDGVDNVDAFMRLAATFDHDVILIDWNLRSCEGTELCSKLRARGDLRPIAIISGKLDFQHGLEIAATAGANTYIEKPTGLEQLADNIRSLVRPVDSNQQRSKAFHCTLNGRPLIVELQGRSQQRVVLSNLVVDMRRKEYDVLTTLLDNAGRIVETRKS